MLDPIPRLYVPLLEPEDVVRHLGKQENHWKEGRSAHALTQLWFLKNGFPTSIATVLKSHPVFESAELIDAFLERQVDLGTAGRPSQTDLLAVTGLDQGIAIVAVEGKAGESFGEPVDKWFDGSASKKARLDKLCTTLGLSYDKARLLRYQLLHRSASAIYEAKRYRTDTAAILVHSFGNPKNGFSDFSAFLQALGAEEVTPGTLEGPFPCDGISLYAGWVQDKAPTGTTPSAYLDDLRNYASRLSQWCDRVRAWCDARQSAACD
jgi:hypothetical protein